MFVHRKNDILFYGIALIKGENNMNEKRRINEFELAFIAELEQGGISFIDKNKEDFVETEYPHYKDAYTNAMNLLYKWWRNGSDKLVQYKRQLPSKLYKEVSDRIINDRNLRFMILKTFHDSQILEISFDEKRKFLKMVVEYDDAFCKTQFGEKIILTFYGIESRPDGLKEVSEIDKNPLSIISYIDYTVKNDKIEFKFYLMLFDTFQDQELSFVCEKIDIKKSAIRILKKFQQN